MKTSSTAGASKFRRRNGLTVTHPATYYWGLFGLVWAGLGWFGLVWAGLGWFELFEAGLGFLRLIWASSNLGSTLPFMRTIC